MNSFKPKKIEDSKKTYSHWSDLCKSCGLCIHVCPVKCLKWDDERLTFHGLSSITIDIDKCIACRQCERICPDSAIEVKPK
ncbi:MAG: 4Fe-4S binding protein [Candidatus Falkowbacteria bacterium]|nr:4Fe-4S binding protein [Candidatus Falkowbacteria bacterium]